MLLVSIVLGALAVRLVLCFASGLPVINTDTHSYFNMSDAILQGAPVSYFPNGYPLIIAAVKIVADDKHLVQILLLLNVLMSTGVVYFSFVIARFLTTRRAALIAAGLVALWPNQLNYTRQLLSEVPACFFLTMALALLLGSRSLSSGIFVSASAMIRSSLLPVGPLTAACLFVGRRRAESFLLFAGFLFGMAMEFVLTKFGIIQRSSNFGTNLIVAIGSSSTEGMDFDALTFTEEEKNAPLLTYLKFAVYHPIEFLWQRLSALWELWGPWPSPGDPDAPRSMVTRIIIGLRFPALLFAVAAVWIRRSRVEIWCVAMPILVITMTHVMFFSTPRFTFPIEPALLILATLGVTDVLVRNRWSWARAWS